MGEKWPRILPKMATSTPIWVILHAVKLHGADGFTSPPKEGVLSILT
jgi:hypothetical protein